MRLAAFAIALSLAVGLGPAAVGAEEPTPEGVWLHHNKLIRVEIAPCTAGTDEPLCGEIVWLQNPDDEGGGPRLDTKNPDAAQRGDLVVGTTVLEGLVRDGPREWVDGTIYNPDDGESYNARVRVVDRDTVHVRVFVMLPLFGETKVWTRVGE